MALSAQGDQEGDDCAGGAPGRGDTPVQGDSDEGPGAAGLGPDTEDPEGQSPPGNLPSSPNIGEMCPSLLSFWKERAGSVAGVLAGGLAAEQGCGPGPDTEQLGVSLRCVCESSPLPPRAPRLREVT